MTIRSDLVRIKELARNTRDGGDSRIPIIWGIANDALKSLNQSIWVDRNGFDDPYEDHRCVYDPQLDEDAPQPLLD